MEDLLNFIKHPVIAPIIAVVVIGIFTRGYIFKAACRCLNILKWIFKQILNKFRKIVHSIICLDEKLENMRTIWNGKVDKTWYNESESEFTIKTAAQLAGLAELVNNGKTFYGKTIILGANIMLNDIANLQSWESTPPVNIWIPIGIQTDYNYEPSDKPFDGIFNGNGYVVSGVYINSTNKNNQGFFGNVGSNCKIKKLGVTNSYINGKGNIGGLVGNNNGKINKCYFIGLVIGTNDNVGGLAGWSNDAIINSYSIATVKGTNNVGGLAGGIKGNITKSYSISKVKGNSNVRGLVGINCGEISNISNSYYNSETSSWTPPPNTSNMDRAKSEEEMKKEETFEEWDFGNIWNISSAMNNGYPYLR